MVHRIIEGGETPLQGFIRAWIGEGGWGVRNNKRTIKVLPFLEDYEKGLRRSLGKGGAQAELFPSFRGWGKTKQGAFSFRPLVRIASFYSERFFLL